MKLVDFFHKIYLMSLLRRSADLSLAYSPAGLSYTSDRIRIAWVAFAQTTNSRGSVVPRIFVRVTSVGQDGILISENEMLAQCGRLPSLVDL